MIINNIENSGEIKQNIPKYKIVLELIVVTVLFILSRHNNSENNTYLNTVFAISFLVKFNLLMQTFRKEKIFFSLTKFILQNVFIYFLVIYKNPFYQFLFFWLPFPIFSKAIIILFFSYYFSKHKLGEENESYTQHTKIIFLFSIFQFTTNSLKRFLKILLFLLIIKITIFIIQDKFSHSLIDKSILSGQKYFIAANLYNNQDILQDWKNEVKNLINYLGPSNCYISIAENGDSTDDTAKYLSEFEQELTEMKVSNRIITHKVVDKRNFERIQFLARLRNLAVEYIYHIPEINFSNTKIIFLNDIIFTYTDVIKLITTNDQDYDMVCGLDFYESFYDVWVSRGIDGFPIAFYYPYFYNKVAAGRVINGENLRVYSCWNGAVVMKAEPFKGRRLYFRQPTKLRQSECMLLITDMYFLGHAKVILNPNVKFAYTYYYYYMNKYVYPWTKNVFTYFYYFFYYFRMNDDYNHANLVDNFIQLPQEWINVIESYLRK